MNVSRVANPCVAKMCENEPILNRRLPSTLICARYDDPLKELDPAEIGEFRLRGVQLANSSQLSSPPRRFGPCRAHLNNANERNGGCWLDSTRCLSSKSLSLLTMTFQMQCSSPWSLIFPNSIPISAHDIAYDLLMKNRASMP